MAIHLFNLAKRVPREDFRVRGARAHVLLLLADYASATGRAWPSAGTLAADSGLTTRTILDVLADLEAMGLISGDRRLGHATEWKLHLEGPPTPDRPKVPTQENSSRVAETPPMKILQGDLGNLRRGPLKTPPRTPENSSYRTTNNHQKNHQGNQREARRGARLPGDWKPSAADTDFATRLGLDPPIVADVFRDYWRGKAGPAALKVDWSSTWRNWCRREVKTRASPPRAARPSPRVDTATWLAGFGTPSEDELDSLPFIESEGSAQ